MLGTFKKIINRIIRTFKHTKHIIMINRFNKSNSEQKLGQNYCFVNEFGKLVTGKKAAAQFECQNDTKYAEDGKGITEIDYARWEKAQRYEKRSWLEGAGLEVTDDRNHDHERNFGSYHVLEDISFRNAIEIGCGPFTNMAHILKYINCREITLLDPLIIQYLNHPNCRYKNRILDNFEGRNVNVIALPVEKYETEDTYDLVVAINVVEHCYSADIFFNRLHSLLEPKGILIFHDKMIPKDRINELTLHVYDAGHPLRITQEMVLDYLSNYFENIYTKFGVISTPIGDMSSIYYIGRRKQELLK